jgi:hypothetical protein
MALSFNVAYLNQIQLNQNNQPANNLAKYSRRFINLRNFGLIFS